MHREIGEIKRRVHGLERDFRIVKTTPHIQSPPPPIIHNHKSKHKNPENDSKFPPIKEHSQEPIGMTELKIVFFFCVCVCVCFDYF